MTRMPSDAGWTSTCELVMSSLERGLYRPPAAHSSLLPSLVAIGMD